jgi:hypothetical protein
MKHSEERGTMGCQRTMTRTRWSATADPVRPFPQICQHCCSAGYTHTDNDTYVQNARKLPCSKEEPGESNGASLTRRSICSLTLILHAEASPESLA